MPRVVIFSYKPAEAEGLAVRIRREDFEADLCPSVGRAALSFIDTALPDAVVIDLMHMPSYGRWMGVWLRERKATRAIPLVFVEGDPEKSRHVRKVVPGAVVTSLLKIGPALREALRPDRKPPGAPNILGVPAATKLRIRERTTLALLHAPDGFPEKLGPLPKGVRVQNKRDGADMILLFVKSIAVLGRELAVLARELQPGRTAWILWPKKASGVKSDITLQPMFAMCASLGLSGSKTCAVDETWSGLAVTVKKRRK